MRFNVPHFIERESKIMGPFTFRQFIYFVVATAIAFVFYFTAPIKVFVFSAIILGSIAFSFSFVKINGRKLETILFNFIRFSFSPKTYIWKKKETPITVYKRKEEVFEEKEEEKGKLKVESNGNLGKLKRKIEIR